MEKRGREKSHDAKLEFIEEAVHGYIGVDTKLILYSFHKAC